MDRLDRIRELRDRYESALDEAERFRDEYHREIVKLHRSGMSLREIAEDLGISHQRVHQIVAPHEENARPRLRRRAVAGATAVLLVVAGGLFVARGHGTAPELASSSPHQASPVYGACVVSDRAGAAFSPMEAAAQCYHQGGGIVVIDPQTGRVLAEITGYLPRTVMANCGQYRLALTQ